MRPEFTQEEIDRFWSYVDRCGPDDCWPWLRSIGHNGYGQFSVTRDGKTINGRSNRIAFRLGHGHWPTNFALHTCHWPRCCNPAHLYDGTAKQNTADMVRLGRHNRPHARFTDAEVRQIRFHRRQGLSLQRLAINYGVTISAISAICTHRTYRHVK
jgi:hypothetical protein